MENSTRRVEQLLDRGVQVRALTRNPDTAKLPDAVEMIQGDLLEPQRWQSALEGVDGIYLFPVDETATEVITLAKTAGARRIVDLSAAAVTVGWHVNPVEHAVEVSGLEWTHVLPAEFMTNLFQIWAPSIRAERVVRYPFADDPMNLIHEADIAAVAVAALLEAMPSGRATTWPISGEDKRCAARAKALAAQRIS